MTKRVAYVASAFPELTQTFVLREVSELERTGWDVTVFALRAPSRPVGHAQAAGWRSRVRRPALLSRETLGASAHYMRRSPARLLGLWARALWWNRTSLHFLVRTPVALLRGAYIARDMERLGIGHVHAHFASHPALAALAAAELSGTGFSVTAHAHDLFMRHTGLTQRLRRARFVACISEFNRRYLRDLDPTLPSQILKVVRCGVDPGRYRVTDRHPDPHLARILCVASLSAYKGQVVLLRACKLLRERGHAFTCTLVGDGPLRAQLEEQVRVLQLEEQVRFLGALSEERVAEELGRADVFVAPSVVAADGRMDGIPVALMEALASGVPAVASALSGISELIEHERTGLLVTPGVPAVLADAIVRLVTDRVLAERLAMGGRDHVHQEFQLSANTKRLAELFQRALAATGARRTSVSAEAFDAEEVFA